MRIEKLRGFFLRTFFYGRTGCNSQLPDLRKYYWWPGLFIFYKFCFFVQSSISQTFEIATTWIVWSHLHRLQQNDEEEERLNFLFLSSLECQCLACLCISERWEQRFKGTLPFILYMLFLFTFWFHVLFFLWLVEDTCARYRLYNLWSLKRV